MSSLVSIFLIGTSMVALGLVAIFKNYRESLSGVFKQRTPFRGVVVGVFLIFLGAIIMVSSFFFDFASRFPAQWLSSLVANPSWYVEPCKRLRENAPEFVNLETELKKKLQDVCEEFKK